MIGMGEEECVMSGCGRQIKASQLKRRSSVQRVTSHISRRISRHRQHGNPASRPSSAKLARQLELSTLGEVGNELSLDRDFVWKMQTVSSIYGTTAENLKRPLLGTNSLAAETVREARRLQWSARSVWPFSAEIFAIP